MKAKKNQPATNKQPAKRPLFGLKPEKTQKPQNGRKKPPTMDDLIWLDEILSDD